MALSIRDQLRAINKVMSKKNDVPYYRFNFGRYSGKTLEWVLKNDPSYLNWLYQNDINIPVYVELFVERKIIQGGV